MSVTDERRTTTRPWVIATYNWVVVGVLGAGALVFGWSGALRQAGLCLGALLVVRFFAVNPQLMLGSGRMEHFELEAVRQLELLVLGTATAIASLVIF